MALISVVRQGATLISIRQRIAVGAVIAVFFGAGALGVAARQHRSSPGQFHGYSCKTADCAGHKAGYAWAEKREVIDASRCTGNSQSFIEGCLAFVIENAGDSEDWRR